MSMIMIINCIILNIIIMIINIKYPLTVFSESARPRERAGGPARDGRC